MSLRGPGIPTARFVLAGPQVRASKCSKRFWPVKPAFVFRGRVFFFFGGIDPSVCGAAERWKIRAPIPRNHAGSRAPRKIEKPMYVAVKGGRTAHSIGNGPFACLGAHCAAGGEFRTCLSCRVPPRIAEAAQAWRWIGGEGARAAVYDRETGVRCDQQAARPTCSRRIFLVRAFRASTLFAPRSERIERGGLPGGGKGGAGVGPTSRNISGRVSIPAPDIRHRVATILKLASRVRPRPNRRGIVGEEGREGTSTEHSSAAPAWIAGVTESPADAGGRRSHGARPLRLPGRFAILAIAESPRGADEGFLGWRSAIDTARLWPQPSVRGEIPAFGARVRGASLSPRIPLLAVSLGEFTLTKARWVNQFKG